MAYLNSNSFYSSFARKGKSYGSVPKKTPTGPSGLTMWGPGNPAAQNIKPPATPAASGGSSVHVGPPAGFTPTQSNLPPDPVYLAAIGGFAGTRDDTIAGLQQNRGAYLTSAGYTEDPTTHTIAYDPNNPYSQAALLRKHYQESKAGNTNSYADQGQGYAGSLQNAQNETTFQFNASDDALTKAVQNFLANNTIDQSKAGDTYDTNAAGALGTSVQNAPNNPLYSAFTATHGGAVSTDKDGNMAVTAANGPIPLGADPNGPKLAQGYTAVYGPDGQLKYILDPSGNRWTGTGG